MDLWGRGIAISGRGEGFLKELKIGMLEEMVEEDEEFSHNGCESEFGGFVGGAEGLVEGAQDVVAAGGAQGGHVEGIAQAHAASGDVAFALEVAAVLVEGSDAEEGGGLGAGEGAEFRAKSQAGGGSQGSHTWDLGEASSLGGQFFVGGEAFRHGELEFPDLRGEQDDARLGKRAGQSVGLGMELDEQSAAFEHCLLPSYNELLEKHLGRSWRHIWARFDEDAEIEQGLSVDGIRLGAATEAFGEVADLARIGDGDEDARRVSRLDQSAVACACGFANEMRARGDLGEEATMPGRVVWKGASDLKTFVVEGLLCEIDADICGGSGRGRCRFGWSGHEEVVFLNDDSALCFRTHVRGA